MTTTQGTAGLIQRLAAAKRECGLANYEGTLAHVTIPQVLKQAELVLGEALAFVSAKPAPVEAKTEREWQLQLNSKAVWIDSRHAYFIALSDAEEMVTGRPATAARPMSPTPELAVADEGSTPPDELVSGWIAKAQGRYTGDLQQYRYVAFKYAEWLKQSRSPVQEGAQGQ